MDINNENSDDPPDGFLGKIVNESWNIIQSAKEIKKSMEKNGKIEPEKTPNELVRKSEDDDDDLQVLSEEEVHEFLKELENPDFSEDSNFPPNRRLEESGAITPSDSLPPSRATPRGRRKALEMRKIKETPGGLITVKREQNRNNSKRYLERKKLTKEGLEDSIFDLKAESEELRKSIDSMGIADNFWIKKKNQLAHTIFEKRNDGRLKIKEDVHKFETKLEQIAEDKVSSTIKPGTLGARKSRAGQSLETAELKLEKYELETTIEQLKAIKALLGRHATGPIPLQCHGPSGRFEENAQLHEIGDTSGDTSSDAGAPDDLSVEEHESDDGNGPPPLSPHHPTTHDHRNFTVGDYSVECAVKTEPSTSPPNADRSLEFPGLGCSLAPRLSNGTSSKPFTSRSSPTGSRHQAHSGIGTSAGTPQHPGARPDEGFRQNLTHSVQTTAKSSPTGHFGPGMPAYTPCCALPARSAGMPTLRVMSHPKSPTYNTNIGPPPFRLQDPGLKAALDASTRASTPRVIAKPLIYLKKRGPSSPPPVSTNGRNMTAQHTGDRSAEGSTQQGFRRISTQDYYNEKDVMSSPRPLAKQGHTGISFPTGAFQPVAPASERNSPFFAHVPEQNADRIELLQVPTDVKLSMYPPMLRLSPHPAISSFDGTSGGPSGRAGAESSAGPPVAHQDRSGSMFAASSARDQAEAASQPTNYGTKREPQPGHYGCTVTPTLPPTVPLPAGNRRTQAGSYLAPSGPAHWQGREPISRKRTAVSEGSLELLDEAATSSPRKRAYTLHGELESMDKGSGFNQ
ncbi:hypothetical protein L5515_003219 [Caenorhabditis briggsae]|uniref:BZIP domain-containing protein n=1 Tax=Caenorhabditis briggsae TaxID=6238 RepID=A0AAE9EE90_CAEBR|nr:hypothetical protein L5515_003217 [Caenorhabditis briggsae]UMM21615.1 hypothetical protein L5515_003218 [Caenorhabditis briggsae]UMM21616.1 hypothetical protein L5515_003219 [Caenorhabditis briggsae]